MNCNNLGLNTNDVHLRAVYLVLFDLLWRKKAALARWASSCFCVRVLGDLSGCSDMVVGTTAWVEAMDCVPPSCRWPLKTRWVRGLGPRCSRKDRKAHGFKADVCAGEGGGGPPLRATRQPTCHRGTRNGTDSLEQETMGGRERGRLEREDKGRPRCKAETRFPAAAASRYQW